MDRYQIARGLKKPEEPVEEYVKSFGFGDEPEVVKNLRKRRKRGGREYFNPNFDEPVRVGLVYEDQKKILTGTYAHFCKTYFLCKSGQGEREVCCRHSKRLYRTGCTLIVYNNIRSETVALTGSSRYQILPWVFGPAIYDVLKKIHENFPLFQHDILVKRDHRTLKTYAMQPLGNSLWQASTPQIREKVINNARPVMENMKDCIGADLSVEEIEELIEESNDEQSRNNRASVDPVSGAPRRRTDSVSGAPRGDVVNVPLMEFLSGEAGDDI